MTQIDKARTTQWRIRMVLAVIAISSLPAALPALAQTSRGDGPNIPAKPTMVWANAFYGANSSGVGLGYKWWFMGIGGSIYGFAGDSANFLPTRPGGRGYTVDGYLFIGTTGWLWIYGNIGWGGRIDSYEGQDAVVDRYTEQIGLVAGGGLTFSLLSRFVLGIGYSGIFPQPEEKEGPTYNALHRVAVQVGYRY